MKKGWGVFFLSAMLIGILSACEKPQYEVRIGVSFGVGTAVRWELERDYMEARAEELGAEVEVRLNRGDTPKTQVEDCIEMIDGGIDVLVLTPRDVSDASDILAYAKKKRVPVISYARVVLGEKVDLFVGYDSTRIGQKLGQYLSEMVYEGDYILLRGDEGDNNAALLHAGAMRYISPIMQNINVILDEPVPGWSADEAKQMVLNAVAGNNNHVDAILAPNDKIAGACAEALEELGITEHVVITGMDAELDAVKRIVAGKQDITVYMDLKELAMTAMNEAYHMAVKQTVNINTEFDNQSGSTIDANLITGRIVTRENIDKVLIESGNFTKEQVYQ